MIKVIFYAYLSNIYSCRKIAKALTEKIHFMYLSGNSTPNFRTINEFRGKVLKEKIKYLFAEVVKMLVQLGYISLDVQYIDGTKIEAKPNRLFINQAFYNLFLVLEGISGYNLLKKGQYNAGFSLLLLLCFSATGAGIVLAFSTKAYVLAVLQTVPAAILFSRLLPLYKSTK